MDMMRRRNFLAGLAGLAASALVVPRISQAREALMMSGHVDLNGSKIFYESHGEGTPLVLLHGGVSATAGIGGAIKSLADGRRIIAPHLQGHGQTPDRDREFRSETMADDVAALIRHLGVGRVDLMGYSLGGGVALQTAIRHPDVISRLVLVSTSMSHHGPYPEVLEAFKQMEANPGPIAANLEKSPLAKLYPGVKWETLFRKIGEMSSQPFDWSSDVAEIQARTLLIFADADSIRPEHMVDFYKALGGGQRDAGLDGSLRAPAQLAVIPGATHYDIMDNPLLAAATSRFLSAG